MKTIIKHVFSAGGQKTVSPSSPVQTANCIENPWETIGNPVLSCITIGQSTFRVGKKHQPDTVIRKPSKTIGKTTFWGGGQNPLKPILACPSQWQRGRRKTSPAAAIGKPLKTIGKPMFSDGAQIVAKPLLAAPSQWQGVGEKHQTIRIQQ